MAVKSLAQSSLVEPFSTNSMLAGYSGNAFHHLETVRLSSSAASVTFSNLARYSDFQHLQIRYIAGNTNSATDLDNVIMRFNSDSGSNYAHHRLWGSGSSVNSYASSSQTQMLGGLVTRGSSTSFAANVIDILDPFEITKSKTIRVLTGATNSSQNVVGLNSGLWMNTGAVTSITLANFGDSFRAGSRFSLYGIKARS